MGRTLFALLAVVILGRSSSGVSNKATRLKFNATKVSMDTSTRIHEDVPLNSFQNFNLTLLENDPDFFEFIRASLPRPQLKSFFGDLNNFPTAKPSTHAGGSRAATARKFFTVKQMIMFFQKTPMFGKFSYYGCWCFPDGANDISSGYGEPVDDIDKTCKRMNQCYKCASMQFGKNECPSNTEYLFQGLEDAVTGQRYVDCLDADGTCPRSLCECDKKMAAGIASLEDEWEKAYHAKWSVFNREETCRISLNANWPRIAAYGRSTAGHRYGSSNQPDACCGEEGEKFPYNTDGGRRGCCDGRTYSTKLMKCCQQDGVKSLDSKCLWL